MTVGEHLVVTLVASNLAVNEQHLLARSTPFPLFELARGEPLKLVGVEDEEFAAITHIGLRGHMMDAPADVEDLRPLFDPAHIPKGRQVLADGADLGGLVVEVNPDLVAPQVAGEAHLHLQQRASEDGPGDFGQHAANRPHAGAEAGREDEATALSWHSRW